MLEQIDEKIEEESKNLFTIVNSGLDISLKTISCTVYSTDTFSSVAAAWNADQKDPGSNLLSIFHVILYFKSEGCWLESREQ